MWRKELIDMRWRVLFMVIFMVITLVIIIVSKPMATQMTGVILSQMDKMPDFFKKMMTQVWDISRIKENDYYLLSTWQGKNLGQSLVILVLLVAAPLFAREVEKKTIYWLLSHRSRKNVFWHKWLSAWTVIMIITVIMAFAGPFAMNLAGYSVGYSMTARILIHEITAVTFLLSLFVLISVASNDQVKPLIAGILVALIFPVFSFVKSLSWANIYPYIFGLNLIKVGGHIQWDYTAVLWVITLIFLFVAQQLFINREF